jgi:hypothetical protein
MARVKAMPVMKLLRKLMQLWKSARLKGRKIRMSAFQVFSMLLELGLRVYEAQMERKNLVSIRWFNKMLLENVIKTQFSVLKFWLLNAESSCTG